MDEWQRLPQSWDVVRRAVDRDASLGQFLLTGSAAPIEQPTHSGAGRIVRLRMRPMTLTERGLAAPTVSLADLLTGRRQPVQGETDVSLEDYTNEIVGSGFPGLRHLSGRPRRAQLDGYVARIVERDFEELDHRIGRLCEHADIQHLQWLAREIGGDLVDSVVVTVGPAAYRRPDGIAVVPAALFGP